MKRQILPLLRDFVPYKLRAHVCLNNVALPHIPHSKHKTGNAIAVTYDGVTREHQRLRPLLRPGQLREDDAHHEGLDHHACDALEAHHEDGFGALLGGGATAVAYGVLGLHAEEETRSEAVDVGDARRPGLVAVLLRVRGL